MRQSQLFGKTRKELPKDEVSLNAQFLIKGGFIDKVSAGIYTYLPLGLISLKKIQNIIREELDAIGAQEILMPALTPKENWTTTGRWETLDVLFKLKSAQDKEYALGATHEEIVTPLVQKFVLSYKDLPVGVYQIQDKFRDEVRAKSGILRGREFNMKDLYSFHTNAEDLDRYYEIVKKAYFNIYERCGLKAILVEASGGSFSKYSHEFQVESANGEDTIKYCPDCQFAQNVEICDLNEGDPCPKCSGKIKIIKAVEVGNIFKLMTKYSEPFGFMFKDQDGTDKPVIMGCYGIGPSRVLGTIAELFHDEKGLIWPKAVAPYQIHLISLSKNEETIRAADQIYEKLSKNNSVLFDDRDISAGAKFNDADLIGLPLRIVISDKTLAENSAEIKFRNEESAKLIKLDELNQFLSENF